MVLKDRYRLKRVFLAVCVLAFVHVAAGVAFGTDKLAKANDDPFKPANHIYTGKISFLDGTAVSSCIGLASQLIEYPPGYVPAEKMVDGQRVYVARPPAVSLIKTQAVSKPGGRSYVPDECGPDKNGQFFLPIHYPGRYELRLESLQNNSSGDEGSAGKTIALFEAKLDKNGALSIDLPKELTLPFNFYLMTTPGQKVQLFNMGLEQSETLTADKDGLVVFAGPQRPGGPGRKNPLEPESRVFSSFPAKGLKGIINVDKQAYYWLEKTGSKKSGDLGFWVFSYNKETKIIGISPFIYSQGLEALFVANTKSDPRPRLYLNEAGQVRAGFYLRNSSGFFHRNYALNDGMKWSPVEDPYWALFTYHGMAINKGEWVIPNVGGIPALAEGSNTLRFECTVKWSDTKAARKTCAENFVSMENKKSSKNYTLSDYSGQSDLVGMCRRDHECSCPPATKGEAQVNTSVSFGLKWNPTGGGFNTADLPSLYPRSHMDPVLKPYRETYYSAIPEGCKTYLNGDGPLQVKVITSGEGRDDDGGGALGGENCGMYRLDGDDEEYKACLERMAGRSRLIQESEPEPEISTGPETYLTGIRGWSDSIDLLAGVEGQVGELINPSAGPYSTLRYHQTKVTGEFPSIKEARAACGKMAGSTLKYGKRIYQCIEKSFIDICPQNYSWSAGSDDGIVVSRSSMYGSNCNSIVPSDQGGVDFQVWVEAEGYKPLKEDLSTGYLSPSHIRLSGLVKDSGGNLIANATVSLPDYDETVKSAKDGRYEIATNANGMEPFAAEHDLVLQQQIREVKASFEDIDVSHRVYANGRKGKLHLQVFADDKPYANKQLHIIQTGNFEAYGSPTKLVQLIGSTFSGKLTTDASGRVEFEAPSPRVTPGLISPWSDPSGLFPMQGFFELRGDWDSRMKVLVSYDVHNPFPVIRKFVIPGNIDEESWQITPSRVYIDDPDSESGGEWHVTVEAVGSLKILHGSLTKGKIAGWTKSSPFEFHYRPPKMGMDLQKQPELGKKLIEVNLKVALAMFIGNFEDRIPEGSSVKKAYDTAKNALTYLDRATDTTNLVASDQTSSPGESMIKGFDYVFAMTDTVFGLLGTPWNRQLELAKGAYENAKVFHAALKGYEKITNAYQDTIFIPLTVTVEDEMGHKTTKVGKCSVRVWKAL